MQQRPHVFNQVLGRLVVVGLATVAAAALVACGSSKLTGQSTCRDFAQATPEKQSQAIDSIAQDEGAPNAAGLGAGNVVNACERAPDEKLCAVISRYKPSNSQNGVITGEDKC